MGLSLPLAYALASPGRLAKLRKSALWGLAGFWAAADLAAFTRLGGLVLWLSVRMLMLPLSALVVLQLLAHHQGDQQPEARARFVLVASVAAWCSLVQFPFVIPMYFAYVAPLVILAAVAMAEVNYGSARVAVLITVAGYCGVSLVMRPRVYPRRGDAGALTKLALPRGGIFVNRAEAQRYAEVVSLLREHSRSRFTFATPDVPEIYFLSGLDNPTRTILDGFDDVRHNSLDVLHQIDEHAITAIVINHHAEFLRSVSPALTDSLVRRFPQTHSFGPLEVRWIP